MIKQQRNLIIILSVFVVLLAVAYFAVVKPLVNRVEPVVTETVKVDEGEVAGANDRIQLFEEVARADLKSIQVINEYGEYTFKRDSSDKFVISEHEDALYDAQLFSSLVVDCGYTLSKAKVVENASKELWKYGLDPSDNPACYILTTLLGKVHKVWVGDRLVTGGGYYVRYDGRDTVYVLDTSLGKTVLQPVEAYVTPLLAYPSSLTTYYLVSNFSIFRGEDLYVSFEYLDETQRSVTSTYSTFAMLYPGQSYYTPSNYVDGALQAFIEFKGDRVVELGVTDEKLAKYGLDNPAYRVYLANSLSTSAGNDTQKAEFIEVENYIEFSELQPGGFYYAFAPLFDIIAEVPSYKAEFLSWDLLLWVSDTIYQTNILEVTDMEFKSAAYNLDVHFNLIHDKDGNLTVVEEGTNHKPVVKNFRQLYKSLLSVNMEGYSPLSEEQEAELMADENNLQMSWTITLKNGKQLVYKFYVYSDRRAFYTINGNGEFYVLRTSVNKVAEDVIRVMKDETVNSEDKY